MPIVINSPKGPLPSDNRIVFELTGDVGVGQTITPEENNFIGLLLENVSGNYTNGVYNVVNPLPEGPVNFIKLPNVGTELIESLFDAAGVEVPADFPDNLDRYQPNNLTLTFAGGTTATLEGEFVSVDDSDYVWDVSIEFDSPVNWATWSGAGGTYPEVVEDFPLNRLVFNDGMAAGFSEANLQTWIGEAPTDYVNNGTEVFFSNQDYGFQSLAAPGNAALFNLLSFNLKEMYVRCADSQSFSGFLALEKVYFLDESYVTYAGTNLFANNPALTTMYWSGSDGNLFGTGATQLGNVTTVFLPNGSGWAGATTGYLGDVDKSTLTLYTNRLNETNNGGGVQAEVAAVTAAGGTVNYVDAFINPDSTSSANGTSGTFWEVNSANSTLDGKTGSPLEGISLTVDSALTTQAGLVTGQDDLAMVLDGSASSQDTIASNFTITGATTGSIFFGLNSYSYDIGVYINDTLHSMHRLIFSPGDVSRFDVSQITRSVIGRPLITTAAVSSTKAYGSVHIVAQVRAGSTLLEAQYESAKVSFWKARLTEVEYSNYDPADYVPSPQQGQFLTNYPSGEQRLILRDANYYITTFYPGMPADVEDDIKIRRRGYSSEGGSLLSTETVTPTGIVNDGLPDLWKVGVINLGGTGWGSLGSVNYYLLDVYDTDAAAALTSSVGLTLWEGDCNNGATVHFMNKLGGMETYYFPKRKLEEARIEGYKVEVDTGEFAPQDNGQYNYLLQAVDRITLRSDWLSESVQNWLVKELYESPFILIEIDGVQVRAYCRETSWVKRTFANDAIFDVNVEFELSERRYSPLV